MNEPLDVFTVALPAMVSVYGSIACLIVYAAVALALACYKARHDRKRPRLATVFAGAAEQLARVTQ